MATIEACESYRIKFDWANPASFAEVSIRNNKAMCTTSRTNFVFLAGNFKLLPGNTYFWEVSLDNGVNFKVGIIKASGLLKKELDPKDTFLLTSRGFAICSSSDKPVDYSVKYSAGDKIGIYYDGIRGSLTYYLNGIRQGIFFVSAALKNEVFYPLACMMTEGELFSVTE